MMVNGHQEKKSVAADEMYEDLPPIDGGAQAWKFVIGVYFLEGLLWGKAHAFTTRYNSP